MHASFPPFVRLIALGLTAVVFVAGGQPTLFSAERTVFTPADYVEPKLVVPPTPSRLDHLEFRGVLTVSGATFITLVDATNSRSLTLPLGGMVDGVTISDFRNEAGLVRAFADGKEKDLALRESRIVAMTAPSPKPPRVSPGRRTPDLDRVTREIQRRREMRRQLLSGQNSPNVPGPPPAIPNR
jgi:hypothetical protein